MNKKNKNMREEDTHWGISWIDFLKIAKSYGFEKGYSQKFIGSDWIEVNISVEEEIIFFHKEKGHILHAESYGENSVNSAQVYAEVKIGKKLEENQWKALDCCSHGSNGNGTMHIRVDVRANFIFQLEKISKAFEFSKRWTVVPFLWFLNYMDTRKENYDYEEINTQKINSSSSEVQKIILEK